MTKFVTILGLIVSSLVQADIQYSPNAIINFYGVNSVQMSRLGSRAEWTVVSGDSRSTIRDAATNLVLGGITQINFNFPFTATLGVVIQECLQQARTLQTMTQLSPDRAKSTQQFVIQGSGNYRYMPSPEGNTKGDFSFTAITLCHMTN